VLIEGVDFVIGRAAHDSHIVLTRITQAAANDTMAAKGILWLLVACANDPALTTATIKAATGIIAAVTCSYTGFLQGYAVFLDVRPNLRRTLFQFSQPGTYPSCGPDDVPTVSGVDK